ncbi:DEAD/DEAH box helicase family protein [Sulfurimonas sp.]|uniref:DEAD/DEAH box helicase family protein n=1 Tax=Sulfurimonas sp. TaxID=2022749 RepID=UPI0025DD09B3|nr:DEAD/DEAH box helicase family protein [Sulfurimonas sp.]MCK9455307.1 DEAD/DEAH box helicase family protein [Sulfurimonas sp.]
MQDIKIYKQKDLVLKVNQNFDPIKLDLDSWDLFLDKLCGDREYQKESIRNSVIYLASGRYEKIEDLVEENYQNNTELQAKYNSLQDYKQHLQLPNKLFANIDLATGAGKSYIIYGIAQIMFGLGLVDKVLVLCPSLTIESGLTEKFESLSGSAELRNTIPSDAQYKNPRIVDANITVRSGDICVENIHAVYSTTGSSIEDSFRGQGERTLVLNDESHHIFNKISGNSAEAKGLKRWKEFLLDGEYNFKYILGFTGTAYHDNEYFNDIIYRYSLREAIEEKIVKNIEYVQKDDSSGIDEKFQKIYQNHQDNVRKYDKVKPLSILITKDINKAKNLRYDLIDFLEKQEKIPKEKVEEQVLIVTSDKDHKANLQKLKSVDEKDDPIQWIISVSMLTEGWDVKNVFQIVPWEDKAFNSKLLIAQVLGRGLRVPELYQNPQPKVIVFNHDSWSKNIKGLVDEVLEIETRINSQVLKEGERSKYNFEVYNIDYEKIQTEIPHIPKDEMTFNSLMKNGIPLESQSTVVKKDTEFEDVSDFKTRKKEYTIQYETYSIDQIVDKIYDELSVRFDEGKILNIDVEKYSKDNLPKREIIEDMILKSMEKVGIKKEDGLILKNRTKIFQSFGTLLRKASKTVVIEKKMNDLIIVSTKDLVNESSAIGNFRRDYSVFFTNNWKNEIINEDQQIIFDQILEDDSLPRKAIKEQNEFLFKTPVNLVFTNAKPERDFVEYLCKKEITEKIESWIKSRDRGFYSIEYSWRKGNHQKIGNFNPDFIIKTKKDNLEYLIIVEIKSDKDDSNENKAKYKYAKEHFEKLNQKLEGQKIKQKYIFHFLSPNGYSTFFDYLKNETLLEGQYKFRCELENLLEES